MGRKVELARNVERSTSGAFNQIEMEMDRNGNCDLPTRTIRNEMSPVKPKPSKNKQKPSACGVTRKSPTENEQSRRSPMVTGRVKTPKSGFSGLKAAPKKRIAIECDLSSDDDDYPVLNKPFNDRRENSVYGLISQKEFNQMKEAECTTRVLLAESKMNNMKKLMEMDAKHKAEMDTMKQKHRAEMDAMKDRLMEMDAKHKTEMDGVKEKMSKTIKERVKEVEWYKGRDLTMKNDCKHFKKDLEQCNAEKDRMELKHKQEIKDKDDIIHKNECQIEEQMLAYQELQTTVCAKNRQLREKSRKSKEKTKKMKG